MGKDSDARKDPGQEEKWETKDEMVGWHQLNGHEFEQTLGDSEGQGSLVCCSRWGLRVRHELATEQQPQWGRGLSHRCPLGTFKSTHTALSFLHNNSIF